MMATKLRALYQRSKGRDLFDLWLVLTTERPDPRLIVAGLRHYMGDAVFAYRDLAINLRDKLEDADFCSDLDPLVLAVPDAYTVDGAADHVMEQLEGRYPCTVTVTAGAWRWASDPFALPNKRGSVLEPPRRVPAPPATPNEARRWLREKRRPWSVLRGWRFEPRPRACRLQRGRGG